MLVDLTSRNVSQWLLKTRHEFYKRRYGGLELGVRSPLASVDREQLKQIFTRLDTASNLGTERLGLLEKEIVFGRIGEILQIFTNAKVKLASNFQFIQEKKLRV